MCVCVWNCAECRRRTQVKVAVIVEKLPNHRTEMVYKIVSPPFHEAPVLADGVTYHRGEEEEGAEAAADKKRGSRPGGGGERKAPKKKKRTGGH